MPSSTPAPPATSGYSLPDQRAALRERAKGEGYEFLEEIADEGDLLRSCGTAVPERLRDMGPEERQRVYGLLEVRAKTRCDGGLELSGVPGVPSLCAASSQPHEKGG